MVAIFCLLSNYEYLSKQMKLIKDVITKFFYIVNKLFITSASYRNHFVITSLTLLSTLVGLIALNILINNLAIDNTDALIAKAKLFITPNLIPAVNPQPIERLQVMFSLLIIPVFIFTGLKLFSASLFTKLFSSKFVYLSSVFVSFFLLFILFYLDLKGDPSNFLYIEKHPYYSDTRRFFGQIISGRIFNTTLVIFPFLLYFFLNYSFTKYSKALYFFSNSSLLFLILGAFLLQISNRDNYFGWYEHLNAVIYSVAMVQQGKFLLIDLTNQYGLYPHFLYPLFKLIDVNVTTFSLVMASLTATSYALLYFALKKVIRNKFILFLAITSVLYFSLFSFLFNGIYDSYYAYRPIRMIFPALTFFLAYSYIVNPTKKLYLVTISVSSIAILWNFDAGIFCFLSFYLYICYEKLLGRRLILFIPLLLKHTLYFLLILAITFFLYSLIIYLQAGSFPDWLMFLKYQKIFVDIGYVAIRLPVFNAWNLIFIVYLIGILIGLRSLYFNHSNQHDKLVFFTSLMGLGIAAYYVNRSHDYAVWQTLYPSMIVISLFLDRLIGIYKLKGLELKNFLLILVLTFILLSSSMQLFKPLEMYSVLRARLPDIILQRVDRSDRAGDILLVNANVSTGEKILILAENEGVLYLETKTSSPISIPGSSERHLISDENILLNFLKNNKSIKVFISNNYYEAKDYRFKGMKPIFRKILDDRYSLIDWGENMRLFVPNNLKGNKNEKLGSVTSVKDPSYTSYCTSHPIKCENYQVADDTKNRLNLMDNFPIADGFTKIDISLSNPITLHSIFITSNRPGGFTTRSPWNHLWNIGVLDDKHNLLNTGKRKQRLNLEMKDKFSILIPGTSYSNNCDQLDIVLTYNDYQTLKIKALCK
jgi:hypothetical protein